MALDNARLYEDARRLADRDPLTGFFNHRYLHERLAEEVVRAARTRRPVSVVMLDLDDFKLVNDSLGHLYGDRVLVHVAECIRSAIRASDVTARYGGDEFALILPDTDHDGAAHIAERILDAFRRSPFAADGRHPFPIGGSVGIATHPVDGRSATDLIAIADLGLYEAKRGGGNRVARGPPRGRAGRRWYRPGLHRRGQRRVARGGGGAVRGGLRGYGSTRTRGTTGTPGFGLPRRASGPILGRRVRSNGELQGDGGLRTELQALARRPLFLALLVLAVVEAVRLMLDPTPIDAVAVVLVAVVAFLSGREREEVTGLEGSRSEAESFARILRGLARSVSPDAIVDAIVEELGNGTGADHVAVVRRRPETRNLEAILSPTRAGAPASRTTLPLRELEDPLAEQAAAELAITSLRGRRLTAVPIEPDPEGDPDMVPLGLMREGRPGVFDGLA